ncbi:MAG: alpha/beta fold hydrolase [Saprospiraceae bacterium]|nr:alpha/beta fold hydrolase [Saprospiraceae bacterium]
MKLPVGFFKFHKNAFINYQLNRWYSLGYARKEDIIAIGEQIKSFVDYVRLFTQAGERALEEGRLTNAATYFRAAEFLIEPTNPAKLPAYDRFIKTFDQAFAEEKVDRVKIPYANSYLSGLKIDSRKGKSKGTILACGGFDSFIEEFYCMWAYFAEQGYDVIAFEGPGQGGTLRKYKLPFDHDWEKPTAAVLDFYQIKEATLIGVSMGGYWAIRAGAYEKRITRIVAFPPVYDWLELTNNFNRKLVSVMMKFPRFMNFSIRLKMLVGTLRHTVNQAMFIIDKQEPIEAVRWMLGMNKTHLHSELITQDVLLMTGEHDAFQPPKLLYKQQEALVNAQSVTTRIFTKEEHADQHCQMGNVDLALQTIVEWLDDLKK